MKAPEEARTLRLDADPALALAQARSASQQRAVAIFKQSPICAVSSRAEAEFRGWLESVEDRALVSVAWVDVLAERSLARGLTAELGIHHESPQLLWFRSGELAWHGSHGEITARRCDELLGRG